MPPHWDSTLKLTYTEATESRGRQRTVRQPRTQLNTPQMAFIKQINETLHPKSESLVPEAMHGAINWAVFKKVQPLTFKSWSGIHSQDMLLCCQTRTEYLDQNTATLPPTKHQSPCLSAKISDCHFSTNQFYSCSSLSSLHMIYSDTQPWHCSCFLTASNLK